MLDERRQISDRLGKYMNAAGYTESLKSKKYHALDQCHLDNDNGQDTRKRLSTREESASVSFLLLREKRA